ncbi:hypothetical protein, partial [Xenorhabdus bovienii]|uniref:hypothetical protein n=1 Tax=Xenorhabdus bovienii TaxID=40576 RepID=UPI001E536525
PNPTRGLFARVGHHRRRAQSGRQCHNTVIRVGGQCGRGEPVNRITCGIGATGYCRARADACPCQSGGRS